MLELAPPQHQVQDFVDGVLWVLLQGGTNRRTELLVRTRGNSFDQPTNRFTALTSGILRMFLSHPVSKIIFDHRESSNRTKHPEKSRKRSKVLLRWHSPVWWSLGRCYAQTPGSRWRSASSAASQCARSFPGPLVRWSPQLLGREKIYMYFT